MKRIIMLLSLMLGSQAAHGVSLEELQTRMQAFQKSLKEFEQARSRSASSNENEKAPDPGIIDPVRFPKPAPSRPEGDSAPPDSNTAKNSLSGLDLGNNSLAVIGETNGKVTRYDESTDSYLPVSRGFSIGKPTTFLVSKDSTLILSFPGRIAALVSENSRIVIGPPQNGSFELELRNGTISVLMDPGRDLEDAPSFTVRTLSGATRATDTFFAVTQLKGQSYSMAKRGRIIKETALPTKPDFSSYLQGSKTGFSSGN